MEFLLWVVIAVALAILEIFTAGFFALFFAMGAILTALIAIFFSDLNLQLMVFLIASVICLLVGRPLLKKLFKLEEGPVKASNVSALLGEAVLALQPVTRYSGRVRVLHSGEVWSAYLKTEGDEAEEQIAEGQEGIVLSVDGAKLVIQKRL